MAKSNSFRDLIVWQKAHQFTLLTYEATKGFPKEEVYGLTSQFRRAAVSISANIVEGYKRKGAKDKLRFFNIAQGSLEECRYFIILSKDLGYTNKEEELHSNIEETSKLLNAYCKSILNSLTSKSLTTD